VRIWSIKKIQKTPTNATVNLSKEKFGGSYISAEVRHFGVYIDLYCNIKANVGVLNTTLT